MAGVVVKVVAAVAGIEQGKILFPILYASIDPIKSRHRGMLKAAIQKVLFVIATKKSHPCIQGGIFPLSQSRVSHLSNCNSFFECVEVDFLAGVGFNVAFGNAE